MSKLGKKPITIPKDAKVKVDGDKLTLSGPKGSKELTINDKIFSATISENNDLFLKLINKKNNVVLKLNKLLGFSTEFLKEKDFLSAKSYFKASTKNFNYFIL